MTKPVAHSHQFFLTAPSPCPYLPDRDERKVFTHLAGPQASAQFGNAFVMHNSEQKGRAAPTTLNHIDSSQ